MLLQGTVHPGLEVLRFLEGMTECSPHNLVHW